jgi:poly(hydroxyalkanoate) depolymerase family esterase
MTWHTRWIALVARLSRDSRSLWRATRRSLGGRDRRAIADHAAFVAAGHEAQAARAAAVAAGRFTEVPFAAEPARRFMLYEPARRPPGAAPLLVLLHGCGQGAADFAAGTRMNEAAEDAGVFVLYPEQSMAANLLRCWNWYALRDRSHDAGDAALIAAMTRQVMRDHDIDARRVYVAGMSAGGGMAAVLARDHPQLYAALGVHSGVPAGMAHDVFSALRLMASGPAAEAAAAPTSTGGGIGAAVACIVFHGDEDRTVHPSNGQAIHGAVGDAADPASVGQSLQATTDARAGRRGFTRTVEFDAEGVSRRELWMIHGAGHAWAGGSDQARHTDADGPNASREMLRFFLQHRRNG